MKSPSTDPDSPSPVATDSPIGQQSSFGHILTGAPSNLNLPTSSEGHRDVSLSFPSSEEPNHLLRIALPFPLSDIRTETRQRGRWLAANPSAATAGRAAQRFPSAWPAADRRQPGTRVLPRAASSFQGCSSCRINIHARHPRCRPLQRLLRAVGVLIRHAWTGAGGREGFVRKTVQGCRAAPHWIWSDFIIHYLLITPFQKYALASSN